MKKYWIVILSIMSLLVLSVACDDLSDDSGSDPNHSTGVTPFGSAVIDSSGGSLQSNDGNVRLSFDEGALDEETHVSIESESGDHSDLITDLYTLEPSGMTFDPPVGMNFMLGDDYETGSVAVARFDSGTPEILENSSHWGNAVHVELSSFSTYGAVTVDASPELTDRCEEVTVGGEPCTDENADEACTKFPDLPSNSEAAFDSSIDFIPDYLCVCEQGDVSFGTMRACWNEQCQGPGPPCRQTCEDEEKGEWTGDCYHPTLEEYEAVKG